MPQKLTEAEFAKYRSRASSILDNPGFMSPRELETVARADAIRLVRYRRHTECTVTRAEFPALWASLNSTARGESLVYAVAGERDALVPRDRLLDLLGVAP